MSQPVPREAVAGRTMHLLVSSVSARGRAARAAVRAARILRAGGWWVTVTVTTLEDDPVAMAAALDAPVVGALGGDGFIAAVAQGAHQRGAVLVPMPGGRGNDLCRAIGVGHDPVTRARGLVWSPDLTARIHRLDGIWVEGVDGVRRLALGIVSLGLDAVANRLANESVLTLGPLAYAWGAVTAPAHFKGADFRAKVDGVSRHLGGWVLSVSNSGFIGGGINVVPSSDPFDGRLELLHVGRVPLVRLLPALAGAVVRRAAEHPLIHVNTALALDVSEPVGLVAMADGDEIGRIPLRMSLARGVVRVLV